MRTQSAREETIAVGDMHRHAGASAGRPDRPRDEIAPGGQIVPRIADDGGFAGGAGGCVNARDLFSGYREKAEGIGLSQVVLGREWEAG